MNNFVKICSTKARDLTPVHKYKSEVTGITVIIGEVDGPLVKTFICLGTEAHDDDGLPHTLEHLVFLGSEDYPYKGLLDLLANRCLASGTNAWTDIDHTAYTLDTAGAQGALAMLPIYLDHILYPVLTEHGYITEVHHITPDGTDAGVVYCEMQGSENDCNSLSSNKLAKIMYKNTGFASNTGGVLKNLRESTSHEKVKAFHTKFYRPENITIIIMGQIKPEDVFQALSPMEDKISKKSQLPPYERPWQSPIPPLDETQVVTVPYPTDQEDQGMITLGWRGPNVTTLEGMYELTACSIMMRYLTESPIAPLQKALVEVEDPYASDVSMEIRENTVSMTGVTLNDVPIEKQDAALAILLKCMSDLRSGEIPLDMQRMLRLLRVQSRESLSHMEGKAHEAITYLCIADMLFLQGNESFEVKLNEQRNLKKLEKEDVLFWKNILLKYFGEKYVAIKAVPSADLMEKMETDEKARIEKQIEDLGSEGLEKKGKNLSDALEYNGREVPKEVLLSVPIADICKMQHLTMKTWYNGGEPCPHFSLDNMPFYTRIHSLRTHFIYMNISIDTKDLTVEQRDWLPLLMDVLVQSPVVRDGEEISHEAFISDIETFTNGIHLARSGDRIRPFDHVLSLRTKCEPEFYVNAVKLLWEVLYATKITKERILVVAQKTINEVATIRRSGDYLSKELAADAFFSKNTNGCRASVLRQLRFLTGIVSRLEENLAAEEAVIAEVEAVRVSLTNTSSMWLQLAANFQDHTFSPNVWNMFESNATGNEKPLAIVDDSKLMVTTELREGGGCITGVGGVESTYLKQFSAGPVPRTHPDVAPLMVALQYFTQLEGPMWRLVRGPGLTYGCNMYVLPHLGLMCFTLFKSTKPVEAHIETKKIIEAHLESGNWEQNLFESAKSSLIFEIVEKESTPAHLIHQSVEYHMAQISEDYNKQLIKSVCQVTMESALEVARRWLPNLFDPKKSKLVIVCNPLKTEELGKAFSDLGHDDLSLFKSIEESHLNV